MTLQTSGTISLNDIHIEAGGTTGTTCSMNDTDIRGLISKSSGVSMSMNEWYGAGLPPVLTFRGGQSTTASTTSYNFTNYDIGTASSDRFVVAVLGAHCGTLSTSTFSNIEIGGSAATYVFSPGTRRQAAIAGRLVTAGTTTNVSFNTTGSGLRAAAAVYTITGLSSYTAYDEDNTQTSNSGTSLSVSIPDDGIIITGIDTYLDHNHSLTGGTDNYFTNYGTEADSFSAGSYQGAAETRTLTWTSTTISGWAVAASFR